MRWTRLGPSRRAVSATIGTVLTVAITVLLAGVVYLLVSGTFGPPPPIQASIAFDSQGWSNDQYAAAIVSASGVGEVAADGLTFIVRDPEGVAYFTGPANAPVETSGITTTVFYVDNDSDNRITAGDAIRIEVTPTGASATFEGGVFEVHYQGQQLALHAL